eukprot:CAMPEP_0116138408 /NCGR_PEP_ID=MMETSP0329-20121206/12768_1 /TAXON_ID=697910 /ORGANISM="Pseudo-nitzschia arenysensis, Strain B593" /LENGTH=312 /DNA_ID=CAMNT_0003633393 /DNA_START=60 /DNA_END=995 /DNA_ORIENTATION=-
MVMRCGVENRSKLIFHLGEPMEIHYKLQGYGILVPISWTGKVKVQYLKQWMRIRQAIEQKCAHEKLLQEHQRRNRSSSEASGDETSTVASSLSALSSSNYDNNIIECPRLQDVVFRQGTSGTSHPGNVTFRSLIESIVLEEHYKQYEREQEQQTPKQRSKIKTKRPKQLALEIYEERQRTNSSKGFFLIWNNDKGWWNKLTDKEQICMKIEYMVREFQKVAQKRGVLKPKSKKHATNEPCCCQSKKTNSNNGNYDNSAGTPIQNIVYVQSETSMFRAQDGGWQAPFFANKRQRLNAIPDEDMGKSNMECFGM